MIRLFCYVTNSCNLLTFFNGFLKLYAILVINLSKTIMILLQSYNKKWCLQICERIFLLAGIFIVSFLKKGKK